MTSNLQQGTGEPAAARLPIRHEESRQRAEVGGDVPEVQRLQSGSGEGQAAVRTGIRGERGPARQVSAARAGLKVQCGKVGLIYHDYIYTAHKHSKQCTLAVQQK